MIFNIQIFFQQNANISCWFCFGNSSRSSFTKRPRIYLVFSQSMNLEIEKISPVEFPNESQEKINRIYRTKHPNEILKKSMMKFYKAFKEFSRDAFGILKKVFQLISKEVSEQFLQKSLVECFPSQFLDQFPKVLKKNSEEIRRRMSKRSCSRIFCRKHWINFLRVLLITFLESSQSNCGRQFWIYS